MTKSEITMENHQSTEQKSSQSSDSELAESKGRWKSAILLKLILHSPWLIWIGVGAFLFTVISISLFSITNISYVKDATPAGNANPAASSPTGSAVALLLPGAVVLGCAVGAIAIAKRRQISSQFQFTSTAIARRSNHQPKAGEIAEIVAAPAQPLIENQPLQSPVNLIAENQQLKGQEEAGEQGASGAEGKEDHPQLLGHEPTRFQEKMLPIRGEACTENPLAPLPLRPPAPLTSCQSLSLAQELEPEDSAFAVGTESLAEMLDIRKKLPLSVILGDYQQREP